MKIDFEAVLKTVTGEEIKNEEGKSVTLKIIAINSLLGPTKEDLDGNEKMKRYKLAYKIENQQEIDLSVDELKLLKDLIGKHPSPLVVGQCWEMLDPTLKNG